MISLEIIHQVRTRKEIPFSSVNQDKIITKTEFKKMIKGGDKLVIIDDFVVDVSRFIFTHPGGEFSLNHNIGRDVSKYFHGGYSLENINPVKNWRHSSDARMIVNSLIIGRFIDEAPVKIMKITEVERDANKSGSCKTFKWEAQDDVV